MAVLTASSQSSFDNPVFINIDLALATIILLFISANSFISDML